MTAAHVRALLCVLLALAGLDVLGVLVTGERSFLAPGTAVGPGGFVARVAALGLLLLLRFRWLGSPPRPLRGGAGWLLVFLLPSLVQFQLGGGRLGGDGVMYYVFTRSLVKDADIDLTNEYTHYGLIDRVDLRVPTRTGLRRSIFSIGPAVVSIPFFLLGEGVGHIQRLFEPGTDLGGYGPVHRNAVALGGLLYAFGAVVLIQATLRRHFRDGTALGAALLVWGATFLHWYMVQQPTTSHPASAFTGALAVFVWDRTRAAPSPRRALLLGLVLGLAMCVRWQNGVLLLLPGIDLLGHLRDTPLRNLFVRGVCLLAGAVTAATPQMVAWKALFGEWLLRYPPHGADFVRLDHPFVLETLFSMRHGLLSWTPVFWAGYLGFVPLFMRRRALAAALFLPLLLMTYVNFCSGDWWAGGSFSNRRFDSLLPLFAFGFAASLDAGRRFCAAHPTGVLAGGAAVLVAWNLALSEQLRRGLVPRDDTVLFPLLVAGNARVVAEAVGSPPTWPASWLFAWRHDTSPARFDGLVGRYLFYRQNNRGGRIAVAAPEDEVMLGEGWGRVETRQGEAGRRVRGKATAFAPLDVGEDLEVNVRALREEGLGDVRVVVNGHEAGRIAVGTAWAESRLTLRAAYWRAGVNELTLEDPDGRVVVSSLVFTRPSVVPPTGARS